MSNRADEGSATEAEQDDITVAEPTGRKPWTDAEKAQIRMLFRNLGIILVMVVIALAVAAGVQSILH